MDEIIAKYAKEIDLAYYFDEPINLRETLTKLIEEVNKMEGLSDEQFIHVLKSATTITGISTYLRALLTESAERLERKDREITELINNEEAN